MCWQINRASHTSCWSHWPSILAYLLTVTQAYQWYQIYSWRFGKVPWRRRNRHFCNSRRWSLDWQGMPWLVDLQTSSSFHRSSFLSCVSHPHRHPLPWWKTDLGHWWYAWHYRYLSWSDFYKRTSEGLSWVRLTDQHPYQMRSFRADLP